MNGGGGEEVKIGSVSKPGTFSIAFQFPRDKTEFKDGGGL